MIEAIYEIEESGAELNEALTEFLGLDTPIPDSVVDRARRDDKYASLLFRVANHPHLIPMVLDQGEDSRSNATQLPRFQSKDLVKGATKSLVKWGLSGFSNVTQAVFKERMAICDACPKLIGTPDMVAYKIKLSKNADMRVCSSCGCVASRKSRLSTESCPEDKW